VPTAPEVLHGRAHVGVVEVLEVVEADHAAHADGHVRIRREVQVDLQREEQHAQQVCGCGLGKQGFRADGEQLVGNRRARVRKHGFLREANAEAPHAVVDVGARGLAVVDLVLHGLVADDGARDALVEERRVQQQLPEHGLRVDLSAVNVHDVRDELERVERYADGQDDFGDELGHAEQRLEAAQDPCQILEDPEQAQEHDAFRDEPEPLGALRVGAFDETGEQPAGERVAYEQQQVLGAAPRIEDERRNEQHRVAVAVGYDRVHDQVNGQKYEEEDQTREDHVLPLGPFPHVSVRDSFIEK